VVNLMGARAGLHPEQCSAIATDLERLAAQMGDLRQVAREVPFFCRINESFFIRGRIDALVEESGRIIIRDYKYARVSEARLYQVQMQAYALAIAEAYPRSAVEAEIVFLKDTSTKVQIPLPPLPQIRIRMASLARDISDAHISGNYPRKPSNESICRELQCDFVARCWGLHKAQSSEDCYNVGSRVGR